MRSDSIRISEKHGVNPTLSVCVWCGQPDGQIVLMGRLPNDREAPRYIVQGYDPCPACRERMAKGVVVVECTDLPPVAGLPPFSQDEHHNDVWPTGRWLVFTDEGVSKIFEPGTAARMLQSRRSACGPEAFTKLLTLFPDSPDSQAVAPAPETLT